MCCLIFLGYLFTKLNWGNFLASLSSCFQLINLHMQIEYLWKDSEPFLYNTLICYHIGVLLPKSHKVSVVQFTFSSSNPRWILFVLASLRWLQVLQSKKVSLPFTYGCIIPHYYSCSLATEDDWKISLNENCEFPCELRRQSLFIGLNGPAVILLLVFNFGIRRIKR